MTDSSSITNVIRNWFWHAEELQHALNGFTRPSHSVDHLRKAATKAGFKTSIALRENYDREILADCMVTFLRAPKEPLDIALIVVEYRNIDGSVVATMHVFEDASPLADLPSDACCEVVRMQKLNAVWVAHVISNSMTQTGDPVGCLDSPVLVRLFNLFRTSFGMLAFRRTRRTQVLWCVKGLINRKPFTYYFVCPSVPTITESSLNFERPFLWLSGSKAFSFKPRTIEFDKFLSIEIIGMCTSDIDLFNTAGISLTVDFVDPLLEDAVGE